MSAEEFKRTLDAAREHLRKSTATAVKVPDHPDTKDISDLIDEHPIGRPMRRLNR